MVWRILLNFSYDGNDVGAYLGDASRRITGYLYSGSGSAGNGGNIRETSGVFYVVDKTHFLPNYSGNLSSYAASDILLYDNNRVVPTANEFRVASISVWSGIFY